MARAITHGQLLASTATLRELVATLLSPRFDRYVPRERRDALFLRLAPLVELVEVVQQVRACRDPDDDKFLEVAVNGRADVLVSGDADLLALHPFRRIAILAGGLRSAAHPDPIVKEHAGERQAMGFAVV